MNDKIKSIEPPYAFTESGKQIPISRFIGEPKVGMVFDQTYRVYRKSTKMHGVIQKECEEVKE